MNTHQAGNTIFGILVGMLGGIVLTSAMAWFIFKTPNPYVPKENVVARDLQLPTGVVEELFKQQTQTGVDAMRIINGYRVRTNRHHEIFVQAVSPTGVPQQPEVQVRVRHTASAGGGDKQRFEFYEILGNQRYVNPQETRPPTIPAEPRLVVENQGPAKIAIYEANQPAKITIYDAPAASRPAPPRIAQSAVASARPFVTQRNPQPTSRVAAAPVDTIIKPAPAKPFVSTSVEPSKPVLEKPSNKVSYLEVDFFPNFNEAAKLQERLLAKGIAVQLKEEKVLGKHAGYKVFAGPYLDHKSAGEAKAKLKKMGLNPTAQ